MIASRAILATVRTLLRRKGWTFRDLEKATGMGREYPRIIASGEFVSATGRRKIEKALGTPLWTNEGSFARINRSEAILGYDPVIADRKTMVATLDRRGLKAGRMSKRALTELLLNLASTSEPPENEKYHQS